MSTTVETGAEVRPFRVEVSQEQLDDLRRRIEAQSWVEASYPNKVVYFNAVDKGGHFAAWEEPQIFSAEVRTAFKSVR